MYYRYRFKFYNEVVLVCPTKLQVVFLPWIWTQETEEPTADHCPKME